MWDVALLRCRKIFHCGKVIFTLKNLYRKLLI